MAQSKWRDFSYWEHGGSFHSFVNVYQEIDDDGTQTPWASRCSSRPLDTDERRRKELDERSAKKVADEGKNMVFASWHSDPQIWNLSDTWGI